MNLSCAGPLAVVRQLLEDGFAPRDIRAQMKLNGFAKARISQVMKAAGCASTDAEPASSRGSRGTAARLADVDNDADNSADMDIEVDVADLRSDVFLPGGPLGFKGWLCIRVSCARRLPMFRI